MPSGGVSVADIYHELTGAGASTVQALGIMANMINESGFNPEAIGDQGTSFGLVQQHGNYSYLVTGNPQADMKRQITALKQLGGFHAASGNTPAEAAGNFAANYERCVGCQPGGAQYNGRVANAATVVQYFKTGKWPNVGGGDTTPGPQQATLTGFPGGPFNPLNVPGEVIRALTSPLTGAVGTATSLEGTMRALSGIAADLSAILKDIEWLFVPSHWIRIISFGFGTMLVIPGLHYLSRAGSGDMALAMGILMTTLAAGFYFIAFHNLPDDVRDLRGLLGYISAGIRKTAPPAPAEPPQLV
jgi:hypothetical protein